MTNTTAARTPNVQGKPFTATITPMNVQRPKSEKGYYTIARGSKLKTSRGEFETVLMAFGKSHEDLRGKLRSGRTVQARVQKDGGTYRIISLVEPKAAKAA